MASPGYKHLYNTKRWHRLRWYQLQKEPCCASCARRKRITPADIVDHIIPHRGDEELFFDADNLQSLCKHCHDSEKQQLEKSGTIRGCDDGGLPIDPNHHWNRT